MAIKVLIIDDSFSMRVLLSDLLNSDPDISVIETAKSGVEAIAILEKVQPDCITLDLMMPEMDGLETLKYIMRHHATPTIIVSAHSKENANITLKCLSEGAVSYILKPSGELSWDIEQIKQQLISEIKTVANNRTRLLTLPKEVRQLKKLSQPITSDHIIVIGASTGGPPVIENLIENFPKNLLVPIVIAQHMPDIFQEGFIHRLQKKTHFPIKMIEENDLIQAGTIYCVPSDRQIQIKKYDEGIRFSLGEIFTNLNTPCIDHVMYTIADVYAEKTIGIILTGIGNDGLAGMKSIKNKGGSTIVQDETALLFSMPHSIIQEGLADHVLSVEEMPFVLMGTVRQ